MPPRDVSDYASVHLPPTATLLEIFWLFTRMSSLSFGGGLTAWIYREVVDQRKWLTQAEFLSALTLAQILPGINTANLAIYTGQRLRGVAGATVALIGMVIVPFFAVLGLAAAYSTIQSAPGVQQFLDGIGVGAVGMLLSVGVKAVRAIRMTGHLIIVAALILLVGVLRWPMIPVVLCAAPISIWLAWRDMDKGDKEGEDASAAPAGPYA
jgi:chromate transporter